MRGGAERSPERRQAHVLGITSPYRGLLLVLLGGLALGGAVWLFLVDPQNSDAFPRCVFHRLTGLHCPGCGVTRALHDLLHLRFVQAVDHNLFAVVALPFLAWAFLARLLPVPARPARLWAPWIVWTIAGLVLAFFALRNVPLPPFSWLAP